MQAGYPAIIVAARSRRVERVQQALEGGAELHARDGEGLTALHHAAAQVDRKMLRFLIDAGLAPEDRTPTPALCAALSGRPNLPKFLRDLEAWGLRVSVEAWVSAGALDVASSQLEAQGLVGLEDPPRAVRAILEGLMAWSQSLTGTYDAQALEVAERLIRAIYALGVVSEDSVLYAAQIPSTGILSAVLDSGERLSERLQPLGPLQRLARAAKAPENVKLLKKYRLA